VGDEELPLLSFSASVKDNRALVSLTHLAAHDDLDVSIDLRGRAASVARARVLSAESASAFNDPSAPDRVAPTPVEAQIDDGVLSVRLPAHSFATIELDLA
jgi:alpha-N-arabinofuranosidase